MDEEILHVHKQNRKCHRYKTKSQVHDTNLLSRPQEVPREVKWPGKEIITSVLSCESCLT